MSLYDSQSDWSWFYKVMRMLYPWGCCWGDIRVWFDSQSVEGTIICGGWSCVDREGLQRLRGDVG